MNPMGIADLWASCYVMTSQAFAKYTQCASRDPSDQANNTWTLIGKPNVYTRNI